MTKGGIPEMKRDNQEADGGIISCEVSSVIALCADV